MGSLLAKCSNKAFAIPKFPVVKESLHNELRKRVQQYFDDNKILQTGNFNLYFKAIALVAILIALYIHLIFFNLNAVKYKENHHNYPDTEGVS